MTDIALFEAKNRLSELIERVQAGEEFTITRRGKVVALLALPECESAVQRAHDAVAALRVSRQEVSLVGVHSGELIATGRR